MGVDFIGHGGASFASYTWRGCFELALAFGWKPAGTVAPCDYRGPGRWNGTYFSNDLQEVSDGDALALGTALRRAHDALRTKQHLTEEQAKAWANEDINIEIVCDLADYTENGHFAIL